MCYIVPSLSCFASRVVISSQDPCEVGQTERLRLVKGKLVSFLVDRRLELRCVQSMLLYSDKFWSARTHLQCRKRGRWEGTHPEVTRQSLGQSWASTLHSDTQKWASQVWLDSSLVTCLHSCDSTQKTSCNIVGTFQVTKSILMTQKHLGH